MSNQPKPTGEWTVERIRAFLYDDHGYKIGGGEEGLAVAINDALAAEKERLIAESAFGVTEQKLANQLAAERERSNELATEAREAMEMWRESDKQLADNDEQWRAKVELMQAQLSDNDEQWKGKLAAEKQRTEEFARAQAKANARLCEIESEHEKQLADEKESCHKLSKTLHAAIAAERTTKNNLRIACEDSQNEIKQLREKVERLEDALIALRNRLMGGYYSQSTMLPDEQLVALANTALAKVK